MLAYVFILFAIAVRFLPHPMAFTPVGAALLFLAHARNATGCGSRWFCWRRRMWP